MGYLRNILNAVLGRYYNPTRSGDPSRTIIYSPLQDSRKDWDKCTREEQVRLIRHFEQTTGIVSRLADLFESYTVGTGLMVHPASSNPAWNLAAKNAWSAWCQFPDISSRQSFGTLQGLVSSSWFKDGECFVPKTTGASGRPRLQLIEGHRICTPPDRAKDEGKSIVDGVEIDSATGGRPIGYWLWTDEGMGKRSWEMLSADTVEHVFEPMRPGQYRGIPFLASVLRHLHDLDDLQSYEMRAAKDAAEISHVLSNDAGEIPPSLLQKLRTTSTSTNVSSQSVTEDRAEYVKNALGGRSIILRTGEKYEQHRSDRPNVATREFWRDLKAEICTGAGIPYVVAYPESMQGTVYRGALDAADAFFRARSLVMQDFVRRIWAYVMPYEINSTPVLRPRPEDWWKVTIHPPRSVNVDVGYNSSAAISEIEAGLRTYDEVYGPRGLDWREQFDRLAEQQAYARERGLILTIGDTTNADVEDTRQAQLDNAP